MIIYHKASDITDYIQALRKKGLSSGFVPTMGALHRGHLSLIEQSNLAHDITVCSIFVNPTQFNNKEDFNKYPITIEEDIRQLEESGCDILFLPDTDEIYPRDFKEKQYELGSLETRLEGAYRPGHFRGVCMVVERLLSITQTDTLYLGEKDFQQCMVVRHLIQTEKIPVQLIIAPTVREKNGLAMSSRNMRLNEHEKEIAKGIYDTLIEMRNDIQTTSPEVLIQRSTLQLTQLGFIVDYVAITDEQLNPVDTIGTNRIIGLIAATLQGVRLIDNLTLSPLN